MSLTRSLVAAAFAAAITSPFVAAQGVQVVGGPDPERKSSTTMAFEAPETLHAAISINYSAPTWNDSVKIGEMLEKYKGQNLRLGKNWWTTLDTVTAIEIGGTKIEPGAYYLGLNYSKDGKLSLLVIDAGKAMKSTWLPFDATPWKAEYTAPLTLALDSLKEKVAKMEIDLSADKNNPSTGKFSIKWGNHEASAAVKIHMAGKTKEAAGEKKEKKEEKKKQ